MYVCCGVLCCVVLWCVVLCCRVVCCAILWCDGVVNGRVALSHILEGPLELVLQNWQHSPTDGQRRQKEVGPALVTRRAPHLDENQERARIARNDFSRKENDF